MNKVWEDVIKDFINVRTVITLGAFLTAYGLTIYGKPVPDLIMRIIDLLLGFWFGQKVAQAGIKTNGEIK